MQVEQTARSAAIARARRFAQELARVSPPSRSRYRSALSTWGCSSDLGVLIERRHRREQAHGRQWLQIRRLGAGLVGHLSTITVMSPVRSTGQQNREGYETNAEDQSGRVLSPSTACRFTKPEGPEQPNGRAQCPCPGSPTSRHGSEGSGSVACAIRRSGTGPVHIGCAVSVGIRRLSGSESGVQPIDHALL